MLTDDYKVRLDAFEGPLDLLLFLIRKAEVDIHDIPVAGITDQYLTFLSQLRSQPETSRIDIDLAGEFLVMAATLMELKSRMLAKPAGRGASEEKEPSGEDPRSSLVRQLIEYKRYRDAGESLERRGDDWRRRFPTRPVGHADVAEVAAEEMSKDVDLEDLDLLDLAEAFRKIAESVNFDRLGDHEVMYDDTPIEIHAQDILTQLSGPSARPREGGELEFATLFKGRTRPEMLGLFLALLELIRKRSVHVRQDADTRIYVARREAEEAIAADVVGEEHGSTLTPG